MPKCLLKGEVVTADDSSRDAKRNEVGELIQKTTEVNRTIVELDAQLAHVAAQLNDKRTRGKDERIIIKKFFGKDEGSMVRKTMRNGDGLRTDKASSRLRTKPS